MGIIYGGSLIQGFNNFPDRDSADKAELRAEGGRYRKRQRLLRDLGRLAEELGEFEQSCLGVCFEGTIDEVCKALKDYWEKPDKVTTQMLDCTIEALVKKGIPKGLLND